MLSPLLLSSLCGTDVLCYNGLNVLVFKASGFSQAPGSVYMLTFRAVTPAYSWSANCLFYLPIVPIERECPLWCRRGTALKVVHTALMEDGVPQRPCKKGNRYEHPPV